MKSPQYKFALPERQIAELEAAAKKRGIKPAELIRQTLVQAGIISQPVLMIPVPPKAQRKVAVIWNGKRYSSITEAAQNEGMSYHKMWKLIRKRANNAH